MWLLVQCLVTMSEEPLIRQSIAALKHARLLKTIVIVITTVYITRSRMLYSVNCRRRCCYLTSSFETVSYKMTCFLSYYRYVLGFLWHTWQTVLIDSFICPFPVTVAVSFIGSGFNHFPRSGSAFVPSVSGIFMVNGRFFLTGFW